MNEGERAWFMSDIVEIRSSGGGGEGSGVRFDGINKCYMRHIKLYFEDLFGNVEMLCVI